MEKKIIGILVSTMFIFVTIFPVAAKMNVSLDITEKNNLGLRDGWGLQWSHAYGGYGHSQHTQPIGDIDEDGVNEVIIGGYGSEGARILFYNDVTQTYEQEYFWNYPGSTYNGVPSGVCVIDLDNDGELEFAASFEYGGRNGIFAYDWDGTTLTELDYYNGIGYDFAFDVYACDYDDDGIEEVIIANAPEYGTGVYHVTALEWVNDQFVHSASWQCVDTDQECPMVWSGDPDNDGVTEVVAACSYSYSAYVLSYDGNDWVQEDKIYIGTSIYAVSLGDLDGDGIDEIEIGGENTDAYIYKYQNGGYEMVWSHDYTGEEGIIEGSAIGDADNDGLNEFCVGTHIVHILQWNEHTQTYIEEATLTSSTGRLAGVVIGDCDTDGLNELKATEIYGGASTGSEFIYKYYDETSPITTCELAGEMKDDIYISEVTVYLNATDDHSGVDYTRYKLDSEQWQEYQNPFIVSEAGTHKVKFYSVDIYGNEEEDQTCTFTIKYPCCFEVVIPKGVSIGLKVKVNELCNVSHTDIPWNIEISSGKLIAITPLNGTFDISAGKTKTIRSRLVFGFGRIHLKVTVDDCDTISKYAFVIGPVVVIS